MKTVQITFTAFEIARIGKDNMYEVAEDQYREEGIDVEIEEMALIPESIDGEYVTYRCVPVVIKGVSWYPNCNECGEEITIDIFRAHNGICLSCFTPSYSDRIEHEAMMYELNKTQSPSWCGFPRK